MEFLFDRIDMGYPTRMKSVIGTIGNLCSRQCELRAGFSDYLYFFFGLWNKWPRHKSAVEFYAFDPLLSLADTNKCESPSTTITIFVLIPEEEHRTSAPWAQPVFLLAPEFPLFEQAVANPSVKLLLLAHQSTTAWRRCTLEPNPHRSKEIDWLFFVGANLTKTYRSDFFWSSP
eukprot:TRINITY_DN854_c0_g2_i1.p1 TRINITY_DN854_c0_g2~~TRINITY_DN854_c0_g2_i1.p1  ORF type:complete len:174 (-),score=18.23 TRINITY_DN854_c0_g2_i1:175-696(-)